MVLWGQRTPASASELRRFPQTANLLAVRASGFAKPARKTLSRSTGKWSSGKMGFEALKSIHKTRSQSATQNGLGYGMMNLFSVAALRHQDQAMLITRQSECWVE